MFKVIRNFFQRPAVNFIGRTLLYLLIMIGLVYLYNYSGINQPHFIYNEF
ncbi:teichoic acid D-Ala incorporation-associated protein DltX [Ligilactobacillus equi]